MASVTLTSRPSLTDETVATGDILPVVDISEALAENKLKKITVGSLAGKIEAEVLPAVNAVKDETEDIRDATQVLHDAVETNVENLPLLSFPSRTFMVDSAFAGYSEPAFASIGPAVLAARAKIAAEGGEVLIILRHSGGEQLTLSGTAYNYEDLAAEDIYVSEEGRGGVYGESAAVVAAVAAAEAAQAAAEDAEAEAVAAAAAAEASAALAAAPTEAAMNGAMATRAGLSTSAELTERGDLAPFGDVLRGLSARAATVSIIFDDGYESNYTLGLPLFRKYGFAATLAQEIDRIGELYGGSLLQVLTTEQLRSLIDAGWEVCNHPALDTTQTSEQMVAAAKAENELLRDLLTGYKVKNYATEVITTTGVISHPRFADFKVETSVYRGGVRNTASDRAYRYLFDKTRSIPGTIAASGDVLYAVRERGERSQFISGFCIDEPSNSIDTSLTMIEGAAATGTSVILYGHHIVAGDGPGDASPPWISENGLERILRRCSELGVAVVPVRNLYRANVCPDPAFDEERWSLLANGVSDTVEYSSTDTLYGAARCARLVTTVGAGNQNTQISTSRFAVTPLSRYRVRIRYRIDTDLALTGGSGNRNHGLSATLTTYAGNAPGEQLGSDSSNTNVLNDSAALARCPYLATTAEDDGYGEMVVDLTVLNGPVALLNIYLYHCTGEVRIGAVYMERLGSLLEQPIRGSHTFNTTVARTIYLPTLSQVQSRKMRWDLRTQAAALEKTVDYTFAYEDSATVPAPATGNTCYVLGRGLNAFAGQGGMLATYNGASWTFAAVATGTYFKAGTAEGIANRHFIAHGRKSYSGISEALVEERRGPRTYDNGYGEVPAIGGAASVYSERARSVAFTWEAVPVVISSP